MSDDEHSPSHDHGHHGYDHGHDQGHGHGLLHHHGHSHTHGVNSRALTGALVVTALFLVVEVVGGVLYNSLALLSDAAHMLTDVTAYGIALFALWLARRPPSDTRTYGYARAEILAALVNGATLIAASIWIIVVAARRLSNPVDVDGTGVMIVAAAGIVANLVAVWMLARGDRDNLNIRAAMLHAVTDALSSVGVLATGIIIATTGFNKADSLISFLIAALVVYGSWRLVRESVDVLLDAAPAGLASAAVASAMLDFRGVSEVHDLHIWTLGPGMPALSAHVRCEPGADPQSVTAGLQELLTRRFHIEHSTLQMTTDRSSTPIAAVERCAPRAAAVWAATHIAAAYPTLDSEEVMTATEASIAGYSPDARVSPVRVSLDALALLDRHVE